MTERQYSRFLILLPIGVVLVGYARLAPRAYLCPEWWGGASFLQLALWAGVGVALLYAVMTMPAFLYCRRVSLLSIAPPALCALLFGIGQQFVLAVVFFSGWGDRPPGDFPGAWDDVRAVLDECSPPFAAWQAVCIIVALLAYVALRKYGLITSQRMTSNPTTADGS